MINHQKSFCLNKSYTNAAELTIAKLFEILRGTNEKPLKHDYYMSLHDIQYINQDFENQK